MFPCNKCLRISVPAMFLIFVCLNTGFGNYDGTVPLYINGFNAALFNQEYPDNSINMNYAIFGNPMDSFPHSHLSYFNNFYSSAAGSPVLLTSSGQLQAETGEAMLNRADDPRLPNRDHKTLFETSCFLPESPVRLFGGYRYVDNYSDRYDSLWARYRRSTGKTAENHAEGLAHEVKGGYAFSNEKISTLGTFSKYGYWGATPFFFSPLFSSGYNFFHSFQLKLPEGVFCADILYDKHEEYFDYTNPTRFDDWQWSLLSQKSLRKGLTREFKASYNSRFDPSVRAGAAIYDTLQIPVSWYIKGGILSNIRLFGSIGTVYNPINIIQIAWDASWDYIPKMRNFYFPEKTSIVQYHSKGFEVAKIHTSVRYLDTLFFPLSISLWHHYCSNPIWEKVSFKNADTLMIYQDSVAGSAHNNVGGKLLYSVSLRKISANIWGSAAVTPKNGKNSFSLPKNWGIDLGWGNLQDNLFYLMLRLESRDRAMMYYWNIDRQDYEFSLSQPRKALSLSLKIPFLSPFLRDNIKIRCWVDAGPFYLSKDKRMKDHPKGNLFGPSISVRFDGLIRQ